MRFQESQNHVMIDNGVQTLTCPVTDFCRYEPSYEPALKGFVRIWTERCAYLSDGHTQQNDPFYTSARFVGYVGKIAMYQSIMAADAQPAKPAALPKLYVTLTMTGGDGKMPPGINLSDPMQNSLTVTGDIRLNPADPTTIVPLSQDWRFTICKVRSEKQPVVIDSTVKVAAVQQGGLSMVLQIATPGVWMISDADFDIIKASDFPEFALPSDFQVVLVGEAQYFKVY